MGIVELYVALGGSAVLSHLPEGSPGQITVFGLYGRSGTGKSHKALLLANELGIDLLVDDGLVIKESKILAGRSAKREDTRVGAVRRAIFFDPEDARAAREAIQSARPERVLILGTSEAMIHRIARALSLPAPQRLIAIEQVASREEIARAQRIRKEQGKHVIPAPTLEVKKTFSGYLVDPLRLFLARRGDSKPDLVVEKSVVKPTYSSLGRFYVADTVVLTIVACEATKVKDLISASKITVQGREDGVIIAFEAVVRYGVNVIQVLAEVQRCVKEAVEYMTALNVLSVNITARRVSLE